MAVLALYNIKGGVGKTTLAVNTASALALMLSHERVDHPGRVLLVDCDPQTHASKTLAGGVFGDRENRDHSGDDHPTLGELLLEYTDLPATAIIETSHLPLNGRDNLDFIPTRKSSMNIASRNLEMEPDGQYRLLDLLEPLSSLYDYAVIDTPPNLATMTINSLIAATHVLIPIALHAYSMDSLVETIETIERVQNHPRLNPSLRIMGLQPTMCHFQRKEQGEWLRTLANEYGDLLMPTVGDRGDVHSAQTKGLDIFSYRPPRLSEEIASSNIATKEYAAVANEIRRRMGR